MDVNAANFSYVLPEILNDISCSSFVAFDLEFTGVPSLPGQSVQDQTLQQRYADNKVAAEKYQILQVGLTVCRETNECMLSQSRDDSLNSDKKQQPTT